MTWETPIFEACLMGYILESLHIGRLVTGIVTSRMTRDILYLIGELGPKISVSHAIWGWGLKNQASDCMGL